MRTGRESWNAQYGCGYYEHHGGTVGFARAKDALEAEGGEGSLHPPVKKHSLLSCGTTVAGLLPQVTSGHCFTEISTHNEMTLTICSMPILTKSI